MTALAAPTNGAAELPLRCIDALDDRGWDADAELVDQLNGALRRGPAPLLRPSLVELADLADVLEGDPSSGGGQVDLHTRLTWTGMDGDGLRLFIYVISSGPAAAGDVAVPALPAHIGSSSMQARSPAASSSIPEGPPGPTRRRTHWATLGPATTPAGAREGLPVLPSRDVALARRRDAPGSPVADPMLAWQTMSDYLPEI